MVEESDCSGSRLIEIKGAPLLVTFSCRKTPRSTHLLLQLIPHLVSVMAAKKRTVGNASFVLTCHDLVVLERKREDVKITNVQIHDLCTVVYQKFTINHIMTFTHRNTAV